MVVVVVVVVIVVLSEVCKEFISSYTLSEEFHLQFPEDVLFVDRIKL